MIRPPLHFSKNAKVVSSLDGYPLAASSRWEQTRKQQTAHDSVASAPAANITAITQELKALELEPVIQLPILTLPAEIRNNIYRFAYILSRERSEEYDRPDFEVHGDTSFAKEGKTSDLEGKVIWINIPSFPLLLANKQIRAEVVPIISSEIIFEIKTYRRNFDPDSTDSPTHRSLRVLELLRPMLQDACKVKLSLSPSLGAWADGVPEIAKELSNYNNLHEIIAVADVSYTQPEDLCQVVVDLIKLLPSLAKLNLCLELRYPKSMTGQKQFRKAFEKEIYKWGKHHGGKSPALWVEWTEYTPYDRHDDGFVDTMEAFLASDDEAEEYFGF